MSDSCKKSTSINLACPFKSTICHIPHPELQQRIAISTDRPFMTDDMIHVLLDIMKIETKDFDPTKSVINDQFDTSRVRIYAGKEYKKTNEE